MTKYHNLKKIAFPQAAYHNRCGGYVYLLNLGGLHKIGATGLPPARLSTLQATIPIQITDVYFIPVDNLDQAERELHERFLDRNVKMGTQREWFVLSDDQVRELLSYQCYEDGQFKVTPPTKASHHVWRKHSKKYGTPKYIYPSCQSHI